MGSSRTRARTRVPCTGRRILNHCATREAPYIYVFLPEYRKTCSLSQVLEFQYLAPIGKNRPKKKEKKLRTLRMNKACSVLYLRMFKLRLEGWKAEMWSVRQGKGSRGRRTCEAFAWRVGGLRTEKPSGLRARVRGDRWYGLHPALQTE